MQSKIKFYLKSTKQSNIIFFTNSISLIVKNFEGNIKFFNLPTQITRVSVYKSPHVYKKFKDHYEVRMFKRIVIIELSSNYLKILPLIIKKKPFELSLKINFN